MQVWWCLLQKEFRLMRSFILSNVLVLSAFGLIAAYVASQFHLGIPSLVLFMMLMWHAVYPLLYLRLSIRAERNNAPLWWQSPQSGWTLLSAKLVACFLLMSLSMGLTAVFWLWVMHLDFAAVGATFANNRFHFLLLIASFVRHHIATLWVAFLSRVVSMAALLLLILFLGSLFKYSLRGWHRVLCVILFVGTMFVTMRFSMTPVYDALFHWGLTDVTWSALTAWRHGAPFAGALYWGDVLYWGLLSVLWFAFAGWLLDRKVEV